MAEPIDKPQFDALMARAGLALTEAEREAIRAASHHLVAAAASVRPERAVSVEMATTFAPRVAR